MIESPENTEAELAHLDKRVQRLESAVTALSDTKLMEDRVADRVVTRLKREKESASNAPTTSDTPPEPPRGWFLTELWTECRYFVRMLSDHRYPFSFSARIGPLAIFCAYFLAWLIIGWIPFVGSIAERIVDLILAAVLYKILSREVARYRAMFPDR